MQYTPRALTAKIPPLSLDALLDRYDVFWLDAYGVLVNADGALPGAAAFIRRLRAAGKGTLILSNDASRLPETAARRYAQFGVEIPSRDILTSGLLLGDHFASHGLAGARCIVLGTEDSRTYVREAGGVPVDFTDDTAEVIVLADDDDYPFLPTLNDTATVILRRLERGQPLHAVLPNPDVIYPRASGAFGVCSGAIAAMFEAVARLRDPAGRFRFVSLGKPHRPMFESAARRFPGCDLRRVVMVGDQLGTDILGANGFGIDSVFVTTGISRASEIAGSGARPTWVIAGLAV